MNITKTLTGPEPNMKIRSFVMRVTGITEHRIIHENPVRIFVLKVFSLSLQAGFILHWYLPFREKEVIPKHELNKESDYDKDNFNACTHDISDRLVGSYRWSNQFQTVRQRRTRDRNRECVT